MSETHAIVRLVGTDKASAERATFYLNSETRPDFEEEVPAPEKSVFEALEFAPLPVEIRVLNDTTIDAWFENAEVTELESVLIGLDALNLKARYLFFSDDEEYKAYFQVEGKKLVSLYTIEDDDTLDKKLWDLDWDGQALSLIIGISGVTN